MRCVKTPDDGTSALKHSVFVILKSCVTQKAPRSRCEFCNSGNRKSIYKKHFCASVCRPTLPVRSGRDLRRVGQRTGDQPLTAEDHHGIAGEIAENAHQRIRRPQSRVSGDVDINLETESEKTEGSMETQR